MTGTLKFIIGSVAMVMALLVITGCQSSTKEAAPEVATGISTVGLDECFNCHSDARNPASFPTIFGDTAAGSSTPLVTGLNGNQQSTGPVWRTAFRGWLNGPHGNYESGTASAKTDNAPANTGVPAHANFTDSTCKTCHDSLDDGRTIADFFYSTGLAVIGSKDRPVIGCESCHGAGGNHWGVGPLPYPTPDSSRCGQCHTASFPTNSDHTVAHPEGSGIFEAYSASKHAESVNSIVLEVSNSTTDVIALCSRCHTDEGARRYLLISPGTMTHDQLESTLDSSIPTIQNASANQCRTCHDAHNPLITLGQKALDVSIVPSAWSDEFATCTSCHQLYTSTATSAAGPLLDNGYHAPVDRSGTTVNPFADFTETIADTHFDDPATANIEGYIVDPTSSHDPLPGNTNRGTCRDCHNAHTADITINEQWAQSAHGGFILDVKSAATGKGVYSAAVADTSTKNSAWAHYDFKSHPSRDACQRCHTSTGFRNFANAPTTYNAANNVFVATSNQKEMLYCWACHTSTAGDLRNPNQFSPPNYVVGTASVTNGSATVTGTGTNWTSGNTPIGSLFQVSGDLATYIIQTVNSTTQITLTAPYAGTTASGVNYQITPYIAPLDAPIYAVGTADVNNGSAIVTGTGTNWTSGNTPVGSQFQVSGDPATYIIQTIDSATQITLTQSYAGSTATGVNYQITPRRSITGISGSFVCVSCHSGRETGEYLKSYPGSLATNFGSFNSHYLAAAGVLFRTIGYEYTGLTYSNPANFAHDTIGVTEAGTNGPCVACHMTNSESHLFLPTTRDANNIITAITSRAVCNTCHGTSEAPAMTPTVLNNLETQYNAALDALQAQFTALTTPVYYCASSYPYFLTVSTCPDSTATADAFTAWPNIDTLGAAFNLNMLKHMPMAFVHNTLYTRRLIYDSLDFLDDGLTNSTVSTAIANLVTAGKITTTQQANALAFLNSGTRP